MSWSWGPCETVPYSESWTKHLTNAPNISGHGLHLLHASYGKYVGSLIKAFLAQHQIEPELVAWHGHTVFHDPQEGATFQMGDGAAIVAQIGLNVVSQFRNIDVALGGQGAPLAPLADMILLDPADFYLNLGGISNISFYVEDGTVRSFDISPCNQVFNMLANHVGKEYDSDGQLAYAGDCNHALLHALNDLPYYRANFPKSMDNNWIRKVVFPLLESVNDTIENKMNTCVQHVAQQIAKVIKNQLSDNNGSKVLITGGGAYNKYLVSQIDMYLDGLPIELILPDRRMIEFKEAALMALMGYFFINGVDNVLHHVTGGNRSHIGGCLYRGWRSKLVVHG